MFHPPFCPYEACSFHSSPPPSTWWQRYGTHATKAFGIVRRFRCRACGRTFSVQTFSVHYYAKRVLSLRRVERLASSSMSIRALGREFRCSCGTVNNRIDRLSRQGIGAHTILRTMLAPGEPVCFDGLVSFDRSQYYPNDIGISITSRSRFVLGISHATTRRSGAMTDAQKRTRDRLYAGNRFEPHAIERSFAQHLDLLAAERPMSLVRPLVLVTDEKLEYSRALGKHRLYRCQDNEHRCVQERIPSTWPRTRFNPLFASNYYDREVRKDQAQHRRETACFARNAANGMSRMYAYLVWHNYEKRYLIQWPMFMAATHAQVGGIAGSLIRHMRAGMFRQRVFLSHLSLLPIDHAVWMKTVYDPVSGGKLQGYVPKYAVA